LFIASSFGVHLSQRRGGELSRLGLAKK